MAFNPQDHMTKMGNREYLEVKWRLVWFREVHPLGRIETDVFTVGDMIAVKAIVADAEGRVLASGLSTVRDASQREATWAGRIIEKAETSAIGRALGAAGFGSQFTDNDDSDYLPDSPVERPAKPAQKPAPQVVKKPTTAKGDYFDKDSAKAFFADWNTKGISNDEVLGILDVTRLGEWKGTIAEANALMNVATQKVG